MPTTKRIEIPLSKSKLTLAMLGSLAFVAIGFWFVISPPKINSALFGNPVLIFLSGIASIVVFGLFGVLGLKKIADKNPGLIIDETGITDNASSTAAGHILWSDITEIRTSQIFNQKFLTIIVRNPNEYIERQTNSFKRRNLQMSFSTNGSPINISANTLKCNFDELKNTLQTQLEKNRVQIISVETLD